ncbi:4-oxalocrotonate tautomerase DmpI [Nocardia sp. NBC_01327]|uniref:4-oxalocrotonate tautomerase DmpI n=1 Tax=Nocardia sp. NBC_01327 TaxID=2903593 RepID=UPI002E0D2B05|nr:4-oxalocrotonate tautomerase family protein [Nocardia sp. NBC_01327]
MNCSQAAGRTGNRTGPIEFGTSQRRAVMPIVTIQQGPRTVELKRELVRRVTDAFVDALQIPAEAVQVWIQEVPTDSWAIGGTLTADKK